MALEKSSIGKLPFGEDNTFDEILSPEVIKTAREASPIAADSGVDETFPGFDKRFADFVESQDVKTSTPALSPTTLKPESPQEKRSPSDSPDLSGAKAGDGRGTPADQGLSWLVELAKGVEPLSPFQDNTLDAREAVTNIAAVAMSPLKTPQQTAIEEEADWLAALNASLEKIENVSPLTPQNKSTFSQGEGSSQVPSVSTFSQFSEISQISQQDASPSQILDALDGWSPAQSPSATVQALNALDAPLPSSKVTSFTSTNQGEQTSGLEGDVTQTYNAVKNAQRGVEISADSHHNEVSKIIGNGVSEDAKSSGEGSPYSTPRSARVTPSPEAPSKSSAGDASFDKDAQSKKGDVTPLQSVISQEALYRAKAPAERLEQFSKQYSQSNVKDLLNQSPEASPVEDHEVVGAWHLSDQNTTIVPGYSPESAHKILSVAEKKQKVSELTESEKRERLETFETTERITVGDRTQRRLIPQFEAEVENNSQTQTFTTGEINGFVADVSSMLPPQAQPEAQPVPAALKKMVSLPSYLKRYEDTTKLAPDALFSAGLEQKERGKIDMAKWSFAEAAVGYARAAEEAGLDDESKKRTKLKEARSHMGAEQYEKAESIYAEYVGSGEARVLFKSLAESTPTQLYEQGLAAKERGKLDEADLLFLGSAFGYNKEAAKLVGNALGDEIRHIKLLEARSCMEAEAYAPARKIYEAFVTAEEKNPQLHYKKGLAQLETGDAATAYHSLKDAELMSRQKALLQKFPDSRLPNYLLALGKAEIAVAEGERTEELAQGKRQSDYKHILEAQQTAHPSLNFEAVAEAKELLAPLKKDALDKSGTDYLEDRDFLPEPLPEVRKDGLGKENPEKDKIDREIQKRTNSRFPFFQRGKLAKLHAQRGVIDMKEGIALDRSGNREEGRNLLEDAQNSFLKVQALRPKGIFKLRASKNTAVELDLARTSMQLMDNYRETGDGRRSPEKVLNQVSIAVENFLAAEKSAWPNKLLSEDYNQIGNALCHLGKDLERTRDKSESSDSSVAAYNNSIKYYGKAIDQSLKTGRGDLGQFYANRAVAHVMISDDSRKGSERSLKPLDKAKGDAAKAYEATLSLSAQFEQRVRVRALMDTLAENTKDKGAYWEGPVLPKYSKKVAEYKGRIAGAGKNNTPAQGQGKMGSSGVVLAEAAPLASAETYEPVPPPPLTPRLFLPPDTPKLNRVSLPSVVEEITDTKAVVNLKSEVEKSSSEEEEALVSEEKSSVATPVAAVAVAESPNTKISEEFDLPDKSARNREGLRIEFQGDHYSTEVENSMGEDEISYSSDDESFASEQKPSEEAVAKPRSRKGATGEETVDELDVLVAEVMRENVVSQGTDSPKTPRAASPRGQAVATPIAVNQEPSIAAVIGEDNTSSVSFDSPEPKNTSDAKKTKPIEQRRVELKALKAMSPATPRGKISLLESAGADFIVSALKTYNTEASVNEASLHTESQDDSNIKRAVLISEDLLSTDETAVAASAKSAEQLSEGSRKARASGNVVNDTSELSVPQKSEDWAKITILSDEMQSRDASEAEEESEEQSPETQRSESATTDATKIASFSPAVSPEQKRGAYTSEADFLTPVKAPPRAANGKSVDSQDSEKQDSFVEKLQSRKSAELLKPGWVKL